MSWEKELSEVRMKTVMALLNSHRFYIYRLTKADKPSYLCMCDSPPIILRIYIFSALVIYGED